MELSNVTQITSLAQILVGKSLFRWNWWSFYRLNWSVYISNVDESIFSIVKQTHLLLKIVSLQTVKYSHEATNLPFQTHQRNNFINIKSHVHKFLNIDHRIIVLQCWDLNRSINFTSKAIKTNNIYSLNSNTDCFLKSITYRRMRLLDLKLIIQTNTHFLQFSYAKTISFDPFVGKNIVNRNS